MEEREEREKRKEKREKRRWARCKLQTESNKVNEAKVSYNLGTLVSVENWGN